MTKRLEHRARKPLKKDVLLITKLRLLTQILDHHINSYLTTMEFLGLLMGHWVGDYLLQTSNMAVRKHHSLKWLGLHVLTYTAVILVVSLILFSWRTALAYALFNGFLHLVTDFFTSKLSTKFQKKPRLFYPILGFDQLTHTACLYWTFLNSEAFLF